MPRSLPEHLDPSALSLHHGLKEPRCLILASSLPEPGSGKRRSRHTAVRLCPSCPGGSIRTPTLPVRDPALPRGRR